MSDVNAEAPYPFGDSPQAIERLDLMARLFEPGTTALLDRWAPDAPGLALDLGCGPGHTTAAIARHCRPRRLVGIDASAPMVAATAQRLADTTGAGAVVADVTGPLPDAPADLVHARYLLSHLNDPRAALGGWCAQLRPGGRLLIDEIERIDTTVEPFRRYLDLVTAMMGARGTDLFVGHGLAGHVPAGAAPVGDELVELPQPTAGVARMFALNLQVWREGPWARAEVAPAVLDRLADDLAALVVADDRVADGRSVWTHRQLAWTTAAND
jgi:trans-aconitate 2-methyltransferase